jgi:hypothetical protein
MQEPVRAQREMKGRTVAFVTLTRHDVSVSPTIRPWAAQTLNLLPETPLRARAQKRHRATIVAQNWKAGRNMRDGKKLTERQKRLIYLLF